MDGYTPAELGFDLPEGMPPPPLRFSLQPVPPSPTAAPPTAEPEPSPSVETFPTPRPARRAARAASPRPSPTPRTRLGDLVPLDASVTPPRHASGESPRYPEEARRLRLLGSVTVEALVDEYGIPQSVRVVESAGDVLDTTVVDAVRQWRYEPARRDGVPVKVRWRYRHSFVLP
jgi:protein TonB